MKSFYEWLMEQVERQDLVGDFARNTQRSEDAPKGWTNFPKWHRYLSSKGADVVVVEALVEAWEEYDPTAETYVYEDDEEGEG